MLVAHVTALALVLPTHALALPQAGGLPLMAQEPAGAGTAAPAAPVQVFASVKVDAEGFGEVGSKVQVRVAQEAESVLLSEGIKRRSSVSDMIVFLKVTPPANGDEGYVFGVAVSHLGKPIVEVSEVACELCVEDELIEKVAVTLREIAPQMRAHMEKIAADEAEKARLEAEKNKPPPEGGTGAGTGTGTGTEPEPEPEPERFGPKGKAGFGLVAAGVVGLGVGVGLALRSPTQKDPTIGYELVDTRPPGYGVLAVGGALAVTGAVLLILDARERQRRLDKNAVAPVVGPGAVGLVWSGRF